ncbi:MAG: hypothetical protein ABIZ49_01525 [Opitutaceae bacterium]
MKKFLFLLLLTAASLGAEAVNLDLGSRGRLTLYFPEGWKAATTDMAGQMTVNVSPAGDENAACSLLITFPQEDRVDTKPRLKLRVEADCLPIAEGSVERKAIAKEFSLGAGFGFYCSFTDPELRGKPPEKGNYKVMSIGKIRLAPDVLVEVSISADSFRDRPYQDLLGAIEGMEYRRR